MTLRQQYAFPCSPGYLRILWAFLWAVLCGEHPGCREELNQSRWPASLRRAPAVPAKDPCASPPRHIRKDATHAR
jgi:hypothetical protein